MKKIIIFNEFSVIEKFLSKKTFHILWLTIFTLLMVCFSAQAQQQIKYFKSWNCDRGFYEFGIKCIFKGAKELKENQAKKLEKYFEAYYSDGRLEFSFLFLKVPISKKFLEKGDKDYPSHFPSRKIEYDSTGLVIKETINPFTKEHTVWKTTYGNQKVESRGYNHKGELFSTWIAIYKDNLRIKKTAYFGPEEKFFGYQTYDHKTGLVKTFNSKDELVSEKKEEFIK